MGPIVQGIISWMISKRKWMKMSSICRLSRLVRLRKLDKTVLPRLNKEELLLKGKLKNLKLMNDNISNIIYSLQISLLASPQKTSSMATSQLQTLKFLSALDIRIQLTSFQLQSKFCKAFSFCHNTLKSHFLY